MYILFKMGIFHCYVCLPEGICFCKQTLSFAPLGILANTETENGFMEPKYPFVLEVTIHPNHDLTRWLDPYRGQVMELFTWYLPSLKRTANTPENGCLEQEYPFQARPMVRVFAVSFRVCVWTLNETSTKHFGQPTANKTSQQIYHLESRWLAIPQRVAVF